MNRKLGTLTIGIGLLALAACGERPQTLESGARKPDQKVAQQPADKSEVAPGWTDGDKASWEQQIRNRSQAQNEYARSVPAKP